MISLLARHGHGPDGVHSVLLVLHDHEIGLNILVAQACSLVSLVVGLSPLCNQPMPTLIRIPDPFITEGKSLLPLLI